MRTRVITRWLTMGVLLATCGCSQTGTPSDSTGSSSNSPAKPIFAPPPIVIDAGTTLTVTVDQTVGTKTNSSGDRFAASLAEPLTVGGRDVLPVGTRASGTVTQAVTAGHLKGGAALALTLDSITVHGTKYSIETSTYEEAGKGRGKRTLVGGGGGAAAGAIIGAIAGGGKGAAIGALAGGGAGTAGAAYTGNRDITIPAETRLHFKLTKPVSISQ
ncbi:MAG TPA: hypothetical protein VJO53_01820 [Candidatus Acidoferrales bacterium]|nr:hypothetical protein [Candidatus Acidoferrales bacterium]